MNHTQKYSSPIIFMGTGPFAATILERLIADGYHVSAVFTKPPNHKMIPKKAKENNQVLTLAHKKNCKIYTPKGRLDKTEIAEIASHNPTLIVVASYGKILPQAILDIPKKGCINVHASLLPLYRGASPIQHALLDNKEETGNTIMLMDAGLDTGPILAQEPFAINPTDTTETLLPKLAIHGADLLSRTLPRWIEGQITPKPQDDKKKSLCRIITREDGRIDWSQSAEEIINRYRAFTPWPGIYTFLHKKNGQLVRLKLQEICLAKTKNDKRENIDTPVGTVFSSPSEQLFVQTGKGTIEILSLQQEGKKNLTAKTFLMGNKGIIGSILT